MPAIFTCSRCGRSYAVPDTYAGVICLCIPVTPGAGALAPSPALPLGQGASLLASEGRQDGGGRPSDGASVSTGRGPEKGPQRSPGAPREVPKPDPTIETHAPSRSDLELAEAWITGKFFKKGGIGDDEWKPISDACQTWGMQRGTKWRDWIKDKWATERRTVVKVLMTARVIPLPEAIPGTDLSKDTVAQHQAKTELHRNKPAQSLYKFLKADPEKSFTIEELIEKAGFPTRAAYEAAESILLDAGMAYEPRIGTLQFLEAKEAEKK